MRAAVAALAGASVVIGSLVGTAATMLARQVVTPPKRTRGPVRIHNLRFRDEHETSGTITLDRTIESETIGDYTILWDQDRGRAHLGSTVTATATTVTRNFDNAVGTPLREATSVRVVSAPQRDIDDLGIAHQTVTIPGELGDMPAWFIPSPAHIDGNWVIHVHGRGATLTEPLRAVPLTSDTGWNSLVIQYRNDPQAPRSPGAKYGLGVSEWRDVDAAIEWAVSRGARRIVLVGWSMGGAIVAQTYLRSAFREHIIGLFLESPAVDWHDTLSYQARQLRMPGWVANRGMRLLDSPFSRALVGVPERINLDELNLVQRATEFNVPMLLLHSSADTVVPVTGSRAFAAARPDLIRYVEFSTARHTRLWNVDRDRWEGEVRDWFAERAATDLTASY